MGMVVLLCLFVVYPAFIAVVVCAGTERYCAMCVVFALHCLSLVWSRRLGLGLGPDPASRCGLV
jgi:hypothetical protein